MNTPSRSIAPGAVPPVGPILSRLRAGSQWFSLTGLLLASLLLPLNFVHAAETNAAPAKHRFAPDVAELAAAPAPAPGGILLVGSSIFRMWQSCPQDFAPMPVVNRAFGGSQTSDQLFFFNQIVPSSRAAVVVWYCGSNDVNDRISPKKILHNTKAWLARTLAALPQAHVVLVSVINAPQKRSAGFQAQVNAVNQGLRELAGSVPNVVYADVNPALETPASEPVSECYVEDNLHLTPEAYRRMASVVRPLVEKIWSATATNLPPPNP